MTQLYGSEAYGIKLKNLYSHRGKYQFLQPNECVIQHGWNDTNVPAWISYSEDKYRESTMYAGYVFVRYDWRGMGICTVLLSKVIEIAREREMKYVFGACCHLYSYNVCLKLGFKTIKGGLLPSLYHNDTNCVSAQMLLTL